MRAYERIIKRSHEGLGDSDKIPIFNLVQINRFIHVSPLLGPL